MSPLFAVRDFLRKHEAATITQVAGSLQLPPATVEDMLTHWQRRGQVESIDPARLGRNCVSTGCSNGGCGGGSCGTAPTQSATIYRWRKLI